MKTLFTFIMTGTLLVFCIKETLAQSTQTKLDQLELMKQYLGIWKGELAKDTFLILNFTSFGKTIEDNYKVVTKGNTLFSGKEIYGYEKNDDKLLIASINDNSTRLNLAVGWFSSKDTGNMVGGYQYLSSPEKSNFRSQWVLVPPDTMRRIVLHNNRIVSKSSFLREKQ